jgi:hypothetical protein
VIEQADHLVVAAGTDEPAAVAGTQQRGRTVTLGVGQLVDVDNDVAWAQNAQPVNLLRPGTKHPSQVFVPGEEHVQAGSDRLGDMCEIEPVLRGAGVVGLNSLGLYPKVGRDLRHAGRICAHRGKRRSTAHTTGTQRTIHLVDLRVQRGRADQLQPVDDLISEQRLRLDRVRSVCLGQVAQHIEVNGRADQHVVVIAGEQVRMMVVAPPADQDVPGLAAPGPFRYLGEA